MATKITLLQTAHIGGTKRKKGETVEVPNQVARQLCDSGYAEAVDGRAGEEKEEATRSTARETAGSKDGTMTRGSSGSLTR